MNMWQPGISLEEMERVTIIQALRFYQGSRKLTAESLKMNLRTLMHRLSEYRKIGVEIPPYRGRVPEELPVEGDDTPKVIKKK